MEEQTESTGVLFTRCYLQVDADVYSKHVCVQYVKSAVKKHHATIIQLLALHNSLSILTVVWVQPYVWEGFVSEGYVHIPIVTAEQDI